MALTSRINTLMARRQIQDPSLMTRRQLQDSSFRDRQVQRGAGVAAGGVAEGTPQWDALSTDEKLRRYVGQGQDAVNRSTQGAVDAAMPDFQRELQGMRESAIRRGVNLGDIGTRDEGSLASAFQRNIAGTANQNAMQNYGLGLDRLYGYRDFRTGQDNAKAERRAGTLGAVAGLAGTVLGGPLGGAIGSKLGGMFRKKGTPNLPGTGLGKGRGY